MPLNATLLALLACPSDDHAPLREESFEGADTLICTFCATRYPIADDIPVLLLDDATPGPNGVGVAAPPAAEEVEPAGEELEPVVDEPVVDEPVVDEPVADEPATDDAVADEPATPAASGDAPPLPPARPSRANDLRGRVQQRLAELETRRGPRMRRRGSGR